DADGNLAAVGDQDAPEHRSAPLTLRDTPLCFSEVRSKRREDRGGPAGNPSLGDTLDRVERAPIERFELEKQLPVLDRLRVLDADSAHGRLDVGLDFVHKLHRLEDAESLARR